MSESESSPPFSSMTDASMRTADASCVESAPNPFDSLGSLTFSSVMHVVRVAAARSSNSTCRVDRTPARCALL